MTGTLKQLEPILVEASREAAVAASHKAGLGDKKMADKAAVEAMAAVLNKSSRRFLIVCGEGERDKAPLLHDGQRLGAGWDNDDQQPVIQLAVDPLEGTNLCADIKPNSISVLAAATDDGLRQIPDWYLKKLIVGPAARGKVDITAPLIDNVNSVADALDRKPTDLVVGILDRPRHRSTIEELRRHEIRVKLIDDGDLSLGLAVSIAETNLHLAWGIGGAPEGVITAAGTRCLNGEMQAMLPNDDELTEEELGKAPKNLLKRLANAGFEQNRVYSDSDLAPGKELLVVATGVTRGDILKDVRFFANEGLRAETLVLRKEGNKTSFDIFDNRAGGLATVYRL